MVTQRSNLGKDCQSLQQLLPNGSASMRYLMHTPRVGSPLNIGTLPYCESDKNEQILKMGIFYFKLTSFLRNIEGMKKDIDYSKLKFELTIEKFRVLGDLQ